MEAVLSSCRTASRRCFILFRCRNQFQWHGTGTLYRLTHYGFNAAYPSACPSSGSASVLGELRAKLHFVYSPTQGATQQNGFVWMQLVLTLANESVSLAFGQHVDNVP